MESAWEKLEIVIRMESEIKQPDVRVWNEWGICVNIGCVAESEMKYVDVKFVYTELNIEIKKYVCSCKC